MGKTLQQYKDENYAAGKKQVDKLHGQRKETDAATLKQINEAIDKATATQTGQYQQRIDAAPLESRVEYDQNAINDAVSKKRIQETLANMGVTDSGLTSSMQTALAIQKQKADRSVKVNENAKIQAAQNAIDSILADAETKKADAKIQRETATADWYAGALAELENSSSQAAAEAYAADMDYAAKVYDAQQKYSNQSVEYQNKETQDVVNRYLEQGYDIPTIRKMIANPVYEEAISKGYDDAAAQAYINAGGGDAGKEAADNVAGVKAEKFVDSLRLDVTDGLLGTTWKTFWGRSEYNDSDAVVARIKAQTDKNDQFKRMTAREQELAKCIAIAKSVNTSWATDSADSFNEKRLKKICNDLGVDYEFTKDYYDEIRG